MILTYLPSTLTFSVPLVSIPSMSSTLTTHTYIPAESNVASFRTRVWAFETSFPFYTHNGTQKSHLTHTHTHIDMMQRLQVYCFFSRSKNLFWNYFSWKTDYFTNVLYNRSGLKWGNKIIFFGVQKHPQKSNKVQNYSLQTSAWWRSTIPLESPPPEKWAYDPLTQRFSHCGARPSSGAQWYCRRKCRMSFIENQ